MGKERTTGEELHEVLDNSNNNNNECLIGQRCLQRFDGVLPFSPKVLKRRIPCDWGHETEIHQSLDLDNFESITAADTHKQGPHKSSVYER